MTMFLQLLYLCVDSPKLCHYSLAPNQPLNILQSLSPILPLLRKRLSLMCRHLKLKRLEYETEMGRSPIREFIRFYR